MQEYNEGTFIENYALSEQVKHGLEIALDEMSVYISISMPSLERKAPANRL